jgi:predicted phage terminase large subunit-like protein
MKLRPPPDPSTLKVLWKPLPKQLLALQCPVDDLLFGGSLGGGKTEFLLGAWVQHAHAYGAAAAGLIVRRTIDELRDISKRAQRLFRPLGAKWVKSERMWTFPNGATLLLSYLETDDDAERYRGQEFTFIGVDEAGSFKSPTPIDFLRSRLRSPVPGVRKRLILTANPGGKGHKWLLERYVKGRQPYVPFEATTEETGEGLGFLRVYIPSRLTDNPYLMTDPEYVKRIRGSGPSWLVRAMLMGDWNITMAGKLFKREWLSRAFPAIPADTPEPWKYAAQQLGVYTIVQSWDYAARAKETNDRSVCTTWGCTLKGWLLLDVWAGRLTFPDLKRQTIALAEKWRCFEILVEDASSGIGLVDELKRDTTLAIIPINPRLAGDKYTRALSVSALVEQGMVLLPTVAPWLADFLDEVCAFPEGAHDDIVDSLSQALRYLVVRYTLGDATAPAFTEEPKAHAQKNNFYSAASSHAEDYGRHGGDDFNQRRGLF